MILAEYLRFLQTLNTDTVPADVRKLANLVLTNMEQLIPLGTNQGQRIRRIVTLAQTNWNTLRATCKIQREQRVQCNYLALFD